MPQLFKKELKAFNKNKELLLSLVPDKWVLVKEKKFYGAFDSADQAYTRGLELFGPDTAMLIKQVTQTEEIISIY